MALCAFLMFSTDVLPEDPSPTKNGRKGSEKSTALFHDSFSLRHRLFINLALGSGKSDGCRFLESLLFAEVLQHSVKSSGCEHVG